MDQIQMCPIMSKGKKAQQCLKTYCQWWTSVDTIEGIEIWNCAIVIMAMKNDDGKIPV